MLKIQSAIKVLGKNEGSYTSQASGQIVKTYSVATISAGRAENVDVSEKIFQTVVEGHTYILEGEAGANKYGKYWVFKDVVRELESEKEKVEKK